MPSSGTRCHSTPGGCPGVFDLLGTRKCSTRLTGFWDRLLVNTVGSTAVGRRRTSSGDLSHVYMYAFFWCLSSVCEIERERNFDSHKAKMSNAPVARSNHEHSRFIKEMPRQIFVVC